LVVRSFAPHITIFDGANITIQRVRQQQAEIDDGVRPGVTSSESERLRELEQENRELRRANEILRRAAAFFGAELDRQPRK
jgi:transposase